jgi:hypothetical protein
MRKSKKVLSVILSLSMAFSMSLIQPNYQVKADNSYSVLDAKDNGKEEGAEVTPIDISSGKVQIDWSNVKDNYEFVGKRITPIVLLSYKGKNLNPMADYTVTYKNNFYPGKVTMIIKGIDGYTGQITKEFQIVKKEIGNVTIRTEFENKQLKITVNNGSYAMIKGTDYDYTVETDVKGKITITFTGLGDDYTGTYVRTIEAEDNPNAPKETETIKVSKAKVKYAKNKKGKKISLKWAKISKVTGYNVRYATTKKKLKKAKAKNIKTNTPKYTIKKLKKKKYYVQVRAYRTVNGKKIYGDWSKVKSVKVKK